jgi:hypothetical protein
LVDLETKEVDEKSFGSDNNPTNLLRKKFIVGWTHLVKVLSTLLSKFTILGI